MMKIAIKDIPEVEVEYLKNLHDLIIIHHFYQKEWKLINSVNLYAICMIKKLFYSRKNFKNALKHGLVLKMRIEWFNFIKKHGLNHILIGILN